MDSLQAVVLAAIQGLTEFLPISSSGHLVLPSLLLGWEDQGLAFDVAVHVGSLLAVLAYFRRDVSVMLASWFTSVTERKHSEQSRLAWLIILATLPAVFAGLVFNDFIEGQLRGAYVLATTTLVFGVLLGVADRYGRQSLVLADIGIRMAVVIGIAQAVALIPGTSRSGITITAALMMGLGRSDAARFSFFMSMPIIAAAGGYKFLELVTADEPVMWSFIIVGFAVSAVTAYICISVFMSWIERVGMLPFAVYRVALAAVIVVVAQSA